MNNLSIFNWSTAKVLALEPDPIDQARLKMVIQVKILGAVLCCILIPFHIAEAQDLQLLRTSCVLFILLLTIKYLLYKPKWKTISHITLSVVSAVVWTNIFIFAKEVSFITMQFIILIIISSFYILGSRHGFLYSGINLAPVIFYILFRGEPKLYGLYPQELGPMAYNIVLGYNFFLIVFIHYHFFRIFSVNISELKQRTVDMKQTVSELRNSQEDLQHQADFQKRLIAAITHDIKSPLKYLMIIARGLAASSQSDKKKQDEDLKHFHLSASRIYHFTDNLLRYSRLHLETSRMPKTYFNVSDFINENIAIFENIASSNGTEINNLTARKTYFYTNKEMLSVIIHNLLDNAVKFTQNGYINMNAYQEKNELKFIITDSGMGMDKEMVNWCNSSFSRKNSHPLTNESGLGLVMVKELLGFINGSIYVSSRPCKGTVVTLLLKADGLND